MGKPTRGSCLLALLALVSGAAGGRERGPANPNIDAPEFLRLVEEAIGLRESRRLSEAEFLSAAGGPGTVVLDARSRDKYDELHVRGAISLPFTDFTAASLARVIPSSATRVLIYCNNNFAGAEGPFPVKAAPAALNLSTFVALYTYGYRNVWELAPLVDVAATSLPLVGTSAGAAALEIVTAVGADGAPGEAWLAALRGLKPEAEVAAAAALRRPLAPDERAWEALIRSRRDAWTARRAELAVPFGAVDPPALVRIVLGNRGGEDAFTPDERTIGFDLSRLGSEYGDAASAENAERVDRFFAHEYTHLLQRAWLAAHPQEAATPFARAEMGMWREGLGNYYSLSARWRSADGTPSPLARATLAELEPVLVRRMAALACATPEEEASWTADLSMGPFAKKWGALPVALWLDQEASTAPEALARFVAAGRAGVRELARRHLAPALFSDLERARAEAARCAGEAVPAS